MRPPAATLISNRASPCRRWRRMARTTAGRRFMCKSATSTPTRRWRSLRRALSVGPLYAWNADGSTQPGWPLSTGGAAYPAMGELSTSDPGLEVFVRKLGHGSFARQRRSAGASRLASARVRITSTRRRAWATWTGTASTRSSTRNRTGRCMDTARTAPCSRAGRAGDGGQEMHTPAIGDLDGDGIPEIVTASGSTTPGVYLCAYHRDGTRSRDSRVLIKDTAWSTHSR